MNNSIKTIITVTAGVLIGAVLGILFAPDKGSKTRRKIMGKGKDLVDSLAEKARAAGGMCTGTCKQTEKV